MDWRGDRLHGDPGRPRPDAVTPVAAARASRSARNEIVVDPRFRQQLRIVVLIPTRNRASLAIAAIDSVLAAGIGWIDVVVSDNSTDQLEVTQLEAACVARGVRRIRPAQPLPMAEHWDWAVREILNDRNVSHISVLTDRMMVLPGALPAVGKIVAEHHDAVVTYGHDGLSDDQSPIDLYQLSWTGRVLDVPSGLLKDMASRSMHGALESVVPRLLNGVTPRAALEAVVARFGSVCAASIAPDYAFAYRYIAIGPGILYYDRPVLLSYAYGRSNGTSAQRGRQNPDHADFMANLDDRGISYAAPLPGAPGATNMIVHEYEAVRGQTGLLPPVDLERYAEALAVEAAGMDPGPVRRALEAAVASLPRSARPTPTALEPVAQPHREHRGGCRFVSRWRRRLARGLRSPRSALGRVQARRWRGEMGYLVTPVTDRAAGIDRARQQPRPARNGPSTLESRSPAIAGAQIEKVGRVR
jgi:hypothetical protein